MPVEYRNMSVNVLCNDCSIEFETVFHVAGFKCSTCGGYNTRRV
jgi:RING finger/CHY zinc finger protein 1